MQLDAIEMVRRSERALGLAIRKGQDAGEIRTTADGGPKTDYERNGQTVRIGDQVRESNKVSPKDFLTTGSDVAMTYAVTDDVSDEQFESALAEAKEEGNLSRANVVRKVTSLKSYMRSHDGHT